LKAEKQRAQSEVTRPSSNPVAAVMSGGLNAPVSRALLHGVIWRRVAAYCVDLAIIGGVSVLALLVFVPAAILSFGLLASPLTLLFALIPLAYHTLLVGGSGSATLGQRLFDLRVIDIGGGKPDYAQAAVQCILFYVTLMATGFLLLAVFFNPLRRTIHDWLSGTVVVRRSAGPGP
jgi:uncharacterized RDD family membrane protein YckC